ncbi:MAG: hypothetical protein EAZ80_11195 [Runella slithyformis]|nr:MAG: hypothetical protein EAZ80_11195 [Runella slithyformis]TAF31950.1 MAG: hypothetical protein EAZ67_11220 [Cytophagales bacterium]
MPWAKYAAVWVASMIKFIGGPLSGITLGLNWLETALCAIGGMMTSVVIFVFLGEIIQQLVNKYRTKKPKRFSRRTRMAVKTWTKFGIHGIGILTPILFTPIGGTLLAVSFKVNRLTILFWMLVYSCLWSISLTWLIYQLTVIQNLF